MKLTENAIEKGEDYITNEEYQKAESAFELALDEKEDDEKATALLTQTSNYQELVKRFNEGDFNLASKNADEVIQIENGSPVLVEKSEEVLEMIEALEKSLVIEREKYELALNHFEANEYDKAKTQIEEVLSERIEHPNFDSLNEKAEKLSEDIKSALLVKKKEKEEREEKERKEAEEKEKAESSITYEEELKVENKEESQTTYEAEKKNNNSGDWKPRAEYEADMKRKNEEKRKSREAYDAEMEQRNAERDKRNRERDY